MTDYYSENLTFDGDNSFPDCEGCGKCCEYMYVMACTPEELQRMKDYVAEHNIEPIDYERKLCPFRGEDGLCRIWEARPQICKLHHCKVPRTEILRQNPAIQVPENLPLVDLYDVFFKGDESDPRYRKRKPNPWAIAAMVVFLLAVLVISGYVFASKAVGLGHPLTITEINQLVTTGSIQQRTEVAPPPAQAPEGQGELSYALLYSEGSTLARLYTSIKDAYVGFQVFNEDQQLTWVDAGFDVGTVKEATVISQLFRQVMNDNPCYSVQYPMPTIGSSAEGSHSVVTAGNRFMMKSHYLQPSSQEALVYYGQVREKVEQLHQQAKAQSDGTTYSYIEQCFSLLASGMVYSQAKDEGPWCGNNIYGALLGGESECAGMSDALKALLDAEGIPSFIAAGKVSTSDYGHAWNVIYYQGGWYVCDLTRCVGDVIVVAEDGSQKTIQWQVGNTPQLSSPLDRVAAGFMIPQDDYLSGAPVRTEDGVREYSFGGAITMDDDCAYLETLYQAAQG